VVTEEATSSVNTTEVMGWFRPSPPDRSVVLSSAESEDTEGQQAKEGVSYDAPVPVKPAGGAYGDRPVQAPPAVSVLGRLARMPEVVCKRFA
jgi:hypothetical protein